LVAIAFIFTVARDANAQLIDFWSGNGSAIDSIGDNSGTLVNGVGYAPGMDGQQAFSFNGNSYVEAGTIGMPTGGQDRTLDAWFNVTSQLTPESFVAGYGSFGNYTAAYEIFLFDGVAFSQWGENIHGSTIQDGQWYNLAVTTQGDNATLYLNGTVVTTGSLPISTPSGTNFYIGRIPGGNGDTRQMVGLIQDVALFNTALSGPQIQAFMASEPSVQTSTWNLQASGSWNTPGNWTGNTVPNGAGQQAVLGTVPTTPTTVTLDSPQTLGTLMFNNTAGYTLAAGNSGSLTLANTGNLGGQITVLSGTHSITAPLLIANSGALVTLIGGSSVNVSGNISEAGGSQSLTLAGGAGFLSLSGSNSYSGSTIIISGALQAVDGVGLPTNSNLVFNGSLAQNGYGAVFQSSGAFSRTLGTSAGQVQWTGDGGFAANGGPLTVSLSPGVPLVWNSINNNN